MPKIQRSAHVSYSCQQMFDLINDIAAYPQYMPGCVGAEILDSGDGWLTARLDLKGAGIKQSFATKNTLQPPTCILLELNDGPFTDLKGQWCFTALSDSACKISLKLEFSFASKLVGLAVGKLFEKVANQQVEAVCQRAKEVYG